MGRINQYPECTTPDNNDWLLIETSEGTKKIKKSTLLKAVVDLLGNDDISEIGDGTVTGAITNIEDTVTDLKNDLHKYKIETMYAGTFNCNAGIFQVIKTTNALIIPSGYQLKAIIGGTTGSAALSFTLLEHDTSDNKIKVGVVNGSSTNNISGNATIYVILEKISS